MSLDVIKNIIANRPVAFHPDVARAVGGTIQGIFLCQLMYWDGKGSDPEGWTYKTIEQWENETTLSRYYQEKAREKLADLGVIEQKRAGDKGVMHYRVRWQALISLLTVHKQGTPECEGFANRNENGSQTEMRTVRIPSLTETTTKTTTESGAADIPKAIIEAVKKYNEVTGNLAPAAYYAGKAAKIAHKLKCQIEDVARAIENYATEYKPESAAKRHNLDRMLDDGAKVSKWAAAKTPVQEEDDPMVKMINGEKYVFLAGTGWMPVNGGFAL